MWRRAVVLIICVLSACVAWWVVGGAKSTDQSPSKRLHGFDEWMNKYLLAKNIPGAQVVVVSPQDILQCDGYGLRDVEYKLPMTEETLFYIGSCGKAFTCCMLQTLVEDGLISWHNPVVEYLPEFKLADPKLTREVNILDLVAHRTGYPRHDDIWYNDPSGERMDAVSQLSHRRPQAPLRTEFIYNNIMYIVAGCVAERITGYSWEKLMQDRVINPLGLRRVRLDLSSYKSDANHTKSYKITESSVIEYSDIETHKVAPAGSIYLSAPEMARWLRFMLGRGELDGKRIVSQNGYEFLLKPHMKPSGEFVQSIPGIVPLGYGCGWMIQKGKDGVFYSHGGSLNGYLTLICLFPNQELAMAVMVNGGVDEAPVEIVTELCSRLID